MKLFHHGSCEPDSNQIKGGHQDGWSHVSQKLQAPESDAFFRLFTNFSQTLCGDAAPPHQEKRVYGQFCIETLHESRKRSRTFSGLFV